ncbi:hypothetical protein B0H17DRAFT_1134957 [Mycena rosella]|uniref:Uncharacterized protein n=1 Tax=Mycena rosella TaxID=1033263 RepID=A0AAD7GDJ7_MYCRO|nr:hypothetical protein B0H17DRAFT_1134957 [Mycena rosella]
MYLKALSTIFFFLFHFVYSLGSVVFTNHTVDDTDPFIKYNLYDPNATPLRCSAKGCSPASTSTSDVLPRPCTHEPRLTLGSIAGTTVAVFFATMHTFSCAIHIDGDYVGGFQQNETQPGIGHILGYSNTSIPDGSHYIVIISLQVSMVDFDGLVYTTLSSSPAPPSIGSSDAVSSTSMHLIPSTPIQPVATGSSSTASSSASSRTQEPNPSTSANSDQSSVTRSTATPTRTPSDLMARRLPAAVIAGGVGGGVSLAAAVLATVLFLRRRARRRKSRSVHQPFSLSENHSASGASEVPTTNPTPSYLTDHLLKLEARFDALASMVRRPSHSDHSVIPAPPAYEDAT